MCQADRVHPVAFDIETYGGTTTCIGVAESEDAAVVIPLTDVPGWSEKQQALCLSMLARVLDTERPKIGQNLDYDVQYLAKIGLPVRNVWVDTAVAHSIMHPELPHDLGLLTSLYTDEPYFKDMRKDVETDEYDSTQWRYNGLDCCVTWEIGMKLEYELKMAGDAKVTTESPWTLFHDRVMPAQMSLIRMENRGVQVDEGKRKARHADLVGKYDELRSKGPDGKYADTGDLDGVNPHSPVQVRAKLVEWKCTKARTTDEKTLKKIRARRADCAPFVDAVLACRKYRKLTSTYLEAPTHPDGRMRCAYRLFVTDTGRARSGKDVFGLGMNLQNVPLSQRDWIVPDRGYVFWEADASQIEARFTAWLSGDRSYCETFLNDRDVHSEHAMALFNIGPDSVHDLIPGTEKSFRAAGKTVTHGWGYWMGANTLQMHVNDAVPGMKFEFRDAERFLNTLDNLRPGVRDWRLRTVEELRRNRTLWTPYGRPRTFLGLWRAGDKVPNDLHREAVAHRPQSSAADHMHGALVKTEQSLTAYSSGAECLLYTHDAIAGQCKREYLDSTEKAVCSAIQSPTPLEWEGHPMVIPANFAHGSSWQAAHA